MKLSALLLIVYIFLSCQDNSTDSARKLFQKGSCCQKEGNIFDAYNYYKQAINKEWNPIYEWAAASTAPNTYMARLHAKASWSGGMRFKDLFIFLIKTCEYTNKDETFKYAIDLLSKMPDSLKSGYLKGQIHFILGDYNTALSVWQHAYGVNPDSNLASSIAELFFAQGMYDSLFTFCSNAIETNVLGESGITLYAYGLAHNGDFDKADSILTLFKQRYDKFNFHEEKAWFYYFSGNINKAINILESSLKRKKHRIIQKKLMLSFLYSQNSDTVKLKKLLSHKNKHSNSEKQINSFNHAMLMLSKQDTMTSEKLEHLRNFFMQNTVYHFVRARLNLHKAPQRSFESFKLLPSVITRFPDVTLEYATLLKSNGEYSFALSLLVELHNRGIYSKESLKLYRDLAFRLNFIDESFRTNLFLEQLFPDDMTIKLSGAQLLIKAGMLDSAVQILHKLRMYYPDKPIFQIHYIQSLFMQKEYEKVLLECNTSTAPLIDILPIKARTLVKLNRKNEADLLYKKLLSISKDIDLSMEYADFLNSSGKSRDAIILYQSLIDSCSESQHNLKAAAQNKIARILLKSPSGDKKQALEIAFQAFQHKSDDPQVIDTYAEALRQTGNSQKSIALLQKALSKDRNPLLLNRLASTFNKTNNKNKARKIYNELLELSDSTLSNYELSKDKIRKYMDLF